MGSFRPEVKVTPNVEKNNNTLNLVTSLTINKSSFRITRTAADLRLQDPREDLAQAAEVPEDLAVPAAVDSAADSAAVPAGVTRRASAV